MARQEINAEFLLGRQVRAMNGRVVGRLEEIRVRQDSGKCWVEEFLTGSYAALERLSGLRLVREILHLFGGRNKKKSYRIPWKKLDLSDPLRPRLLCDVSELKILDHEE